MGRLRILTLISIALAAMIFFCKKRNPTTIAVGEGLVVKKEWLSANKNPLTPAKDVRPPDQTFLTFPEWYLVFSPEEQANYFKTNTATTFPFLAHTAQIWESYRIINDQIKDNFPVNTGYHFMIWVIGVSASIEYAIKSWYEIIVGRITDTQEVKTEEDRFNAQYTQEYVDFIKDRPWYEFDFKKRLKSLLSEIPFFGKNFFRKIERRYFMTTELLVKFGYGKLIGMGTATVYEAAMPTTAIVIDTIPPVNFADSVLKLSDQTYLLNIPRYDKFNFAATELAMSGCNFVEIAGNNSAILLSILVEKDFQKTFAETVFIQPLSSDPGKKRIALAVPVSQLSQFIRELKKEGITIEHIFDF